MTREKERLDAMKLLNDGIDRALADPAADMPINRTQERILRSVVRRETAPGEVRPAERKCGACTLCCKLTPVRELNKGANQRCDHQRHGKGCAIYPQRPHSCRVWNCRWVLEDDTADLRRPDHSHYVIDVMPDFVTVQNNETGEQQHIPVLQVWVDPKFPHAHREPALRRYLLRRGEEGMAAIIRYDASDGFVLFPPNMVPDGKWHEQRGQSVDRGTDQNHLERMEQALGGKLHIEVSED